MKTHTIIVVLLILLGTSIYASSEVEGFTKDGCTGDSTTAPSLAELDEMHKKTDENGKKWVFKSYYLTATKAPCLEYDIPTVTAIGTRHPGGGYSGGGGNTGGYSGGGSTNNDRLEALQALVDALEAENFDDEANQALFECWKSKIPNLAEMINWVGPKTKATWQEDPPFQWQVVRDKKATNAMGSVDYVDGVLTATLYRKNIADFARARNAKFSHVALAVQLHELTHIMQWLHDAGDDDGIAIPSPYEYFGMEQEAYHYPEDWYRTLVGSPPFLPEANVLYKSFPGGFRPKRKEYQNLEKELQELNNKLAKYQERIANGEELDEDDQKDIENIEESIK
ncbi:MAG: hypothetical protein F4Y65_09425, partial [Gammaproteobacteria bacterium]|nr:hypothetical protein [Gammaproteobacteria bacterium]